MLLVIGIILFTSKDDEYIYIEYIRIYIFLLSVLKNQ